MRRSREKIKEEPGTDSFYHQKSAPPPLPFCSPVLCAKPAYYRRRLVKGKKRTHIYTPCTRNRLWTTYCSIYTWKKERKTIDIKPIVASHFPPNFSFVFTHVYTGVASISSGASFPHFGFFGFLVVAYYERMNVVVGCCDELYMNVAPKSASCKTICFKIISLSFVLRLWKKVLKFSSSFFFVWHFSDL